MCMLQAPRKHCEQTVSLNLLVLHSAISTNILFLLSHRPRWSVLMHWQRSAQP
jgi:hypothetical protein